MPARKNTLPWWILVGSVAISFAGVPAWATSVEEAWKALPHYEYGQDMGALLTIDGVVIKAMASPKSRGQCAARLADLLESNETTPAAKKYICLQLRQIGTPAEVPLLARLLTKPATSEMARQTLQAISGVEAADVLRSALSTLKGQPLVGVINSVAARNDATTVPTLIKLAGSPDPHVATAALWALGTLGGEQATTFLTNRAKQSTTAGVPMSRQLAIPLLRCAAQYERAGKTAPAQVIFDQLSQRSQLAGVRRAALEGLLRLQGDQATKTVLGWLGTADKDRRVVATGHLHALPDDQLDQLLARLPELPSSTQLAVIELATSQRGKTMLPIVMSMIKSDNSKLKLAGIHCLGTIGDAGAIPTLLDMFGGNEAISTAAQEALLNLPQKEVTAALLDALNSRAKNREPVIAMLVKLKCYDAIDPLIEIASQTDPAVYGPALSGLRGIADPDKTDIPRLVALLLETSPGQHRDEVEKTILLVSDKLPQGTDRSKLVHAALVNVPAAQSPKYLPLLGRLGGAKSREMIQAALQNDNVEVRAAAIRGLCNWPNAEAADQLLELAQHSETTTFRRWALRAYIRVVTLASDRPAAETLKMLQDAMKLATKDDDQRLILERTSTVRTMDAVNWLATYLDNSELGQVACASIVELAHHRFLRHPNMKVFGPLLEQVGRISKDPAIVARAKRYRLGL